MALPDRYRCEHCGRQYVIDFSPRVMCAIHGEDDCCHAGEYVIDGEGRVVAVIASPDCITFATSEWSD